MRTSPLFGRLTDMPSPTLLVIDDDPDMAEFVNDVAEDMGFDVQVANSAKECLRLVDAKPPAGIVMDIVMPGMDGVELVQALAQKGCLAPIILMSGYESMYLDMAKSLGDKAGVIVLKTLQKPFTAAELEAPLSMILDANG